MKYLDIQAKNHLQVFRSIDEFPRNITVSESQIDAIKQRKTNKTGNLANQLNLKIVSQVMLTSSIDIDDRLVNSLVGRITDFKYLNNAVSVMYVKFNDDSAGLVARQLANSKTPLSTTKETRSLFGLRKKRQQPSFKRTKFPLTLSWAYTVHKVQSLSLAEGVVSFEQESQKFFNERQMFVALSRIKNSNELYLIGKYNKVALKVNVSARKEYERLRTESRFKSQPQMGVTESSITTSLLNTRSLKKHFMDIVMNKHLLDDDIL